jgi:adenylate cyclase
MAIPSNELLTKAYHDAQRSRILSNRDRIVELGDAVANGRVIPNTADLEINTGRRLNATVLFLDISKFSLRPAESVEEQDMLLRILNLFFSEMVHIVENYGGVIEKNTGDGLMAYFVPDESRNGDVRQRAVAAAMTMFHAVERFINPILGHTPTAPLSFRVCLDHGWITVARVGAARRFNNIVAVGTTANIACKMLSRAEIDTILLGDNVLPGLPKEWSRYVTLKDANTGWKWRNTNSPYRFWEFSGRWKVPA